MNRTILKYHCTVAAKRLASPWLSTLPYTDNAPAVTVFISSMNTRDSLELTLRSLTARTAYPNYHIVVGENASTDGSAEFLREAADEFPLTVIQSETPKLHSQWLDELSRTVVTPYWVAVDSDMLFTAHDWLSELIRVMHSDPELYLLAAERNEPQNGFVEPVSGTIIDTGETHSTWLFCVRTSLREHVDTSFAFHKEELAEPGGRLFCFDTGGRLLREMKRSGLRYTFMPRRYRWKYHHFGALSWIGSHAPGERLQAFKAAQLFDIKRRLTNMARKRRNGGIPEPTDTSFVEHQAAIK